jgi:hypothetical protein
MNTGLKILLFGVTALITALFAVLLFMTAKEGRQVGLAATIQMGELNEDIKNSGIMKYDGTEVYGSDVVNCIKEKLGDYVASETAPVYVYVKTLSSVNTYTNGVTIGDIRDFTNMRYIKPTAIFHGDIVKNINDIIVGINFIQQ